MASRQSGIIAGIAVLAAVCGLSADRIVAAPEGERTISFYHIHTQETLTVTYKKDGQFIPEALKKIDWIMRDWRKNQSTHMDPNTVDIIWEMHHELGSQQPVNIICGYRSRDTNEMLRRTVGGQASQSQHITGKAIDITFPDVPLKRMRYSALIRERGGVGYYPTSGIPFVHVDTARVRAWPRLPRYELALLFPNGHTQHMPSDGGPISPADVRVARAKYAELATQIAEFHDLRRAPHPTLVASVDTPAKPGESGKRTYVVASLNPPTLPWSKKPAAAEASGIKQVSFEPIPENELPREPRVAAIAPPEPALVSKPKLVDRSSRFERGQEAKTATAKLAPATAPDRKDRSQLAALVAKAQTEAPKLVAEPAPAMRPSKALAEAALPPQPTAQAKGAQVAALIPQQEESNSITDMSPDSLGNGWVQAPEFDEDHPEELAYRPFPLAPLLTDSPNGSEPLFGGLQHPDVAQTLETIDDVGAVLPMRFRPGQQVAQVMWAQQFQGKAVHLDALKELDESRAATGISERAVKTSNNKTR